MAENGSLSARLDGVVMPRRLGWIVELQTGYWLIESAGEVGRTLQVESAKRFPSEVEAIRAKARARRLRKYYDAKLYVA